jgi:hypothetical protein
MAYYLKYGGKFYDEDEDQDTYYDKPVRTKQTAPPKQTAKQKKSELYLIDKLQKEETEPFDVKHMILDFSLFKKSLEYNKKKFNYNTKLTNFIEQIEQIIDLYIMYLNKKLEDKAIRGGSIYTDIYNSLLDD